MKWYLWVVSLLFPLVLCAEKSSFSSWEERARQTQLSPLTEEEAYLADRYLNFLHHHRTTTLYLRNEGLIDRLFALRLINPLSLFHYYLSNSQSKNQLKEIEKSYLKRQLLLRGWIPYFQSYHERNLLKDSLIDFLDAHNLDRGSFVDYANDNDFRAFIRKAIVYS